MPLTKAYDVAFVRFRAPDLTVMQRFLDDFGMVEALRTPDRLFMRGYGTEAFIHCTERGAPGFAGFGIQLTSLAELDRLAHAENRPVEPLSDPGGGYFVGLRDPDGYVVEAVAGQQTVPALPVKPHIPWNQGGMYPRQSIVRRVDQVASHVLRLGHVVLGVTDFRRSEAWYKERFGFVTSDEIHPAPDLAIGAFMRCDRGAQPCDHHTLFLLQRPGAPEFMHSAFEVADFDDLMAGHQYLKDRDYQQHWGVGRHYLGSQIFDYWLDPWGHEIEHWTDGDRLLAADGGGIATIGELIGVQWGMKMPPIPDAPGS